MKMSYGQKSQNSMEMLYTIFGGGPYFGIHSSGKLQNMHNLGKNPIKFLCIENVRVFVSWISKRKQTDLLNCKSNLILTLLMTLMLDTYFIKMQCDSSNNKRIDVVLVKHNSLMMFWQ